MPLFPGTFTDNFDLKDALRTIEGIQNVLSISVIHDVDVDKQAFKIMYIRCISDVTNQMLQKPERIRIVGTLQFGMYLDITTAATAEVFSQGAAFGQSSV